jgi:hypothetical protein
MVPRAATELTPAWLTGALRTGGVLEPDRSVASVEVRPTAAGIGFMGEVSGLALTYDGPTGAPATMVAKIPTQDPGVRAMLAPAAVFEREARFYSHLAPELSSTARCWSATIDVEHDDFLLLLEDLSHLRLGDQLSGCSPDDAARALEALAEFHARFWESPALDRLDWLPVANDPCMKIGEHVYRQSLPGFLQVFSEALDPAMVEVSERFGARVPDMLDRFAAMPTTIGHFDYRLDNLFFDDTEGAGGVRIIDFQATSKGGFAFDLGYFLSQNLTTDDRRRNEDDLVRLYHDRLVAGGVTGYAFDQLRRDLRLGVLYGWIIPVFAVGSLDVSSARAMQLWTEVIRRAQAAIADHDAAGLLDG